MHYALVHSHRRIQLRSRNAGDRRWRVIDTWPIGLTSIPERCYAIMSPDRVMQLERDLEAIRLGAYGPVPGVTDRAPVEASAWFELITHLCWQIRSGKLPSDSLVSIALAHRRLEDSLTVMGIRPVPRYRRPAKKQPQKQSDRSAEMDT